MTKAKNPGKPLTSKSAAQAAEHPHKHDDHYWQGKLPLELFRIARQQGTERPFSDRHQQIPGPSAGSWLCACCGTPLFAGDHKFASACGWPAFHSAHAGQISRHRDQSHAMDRTEVRCYHCGAHLGHVFPDGPPPSGERYCINAVSLTYRPQDQEAP